MLTDKQYMDIAVKASELGRCARRKIGCAFVDAEGNVLATGYNGTPHSMPSCFDEPCPAANVPAGTGCASTPCRGVHGETRALMQIADVTKVHTVYTTKAPCTSCTLNIMETGCKRIVVQTDSNDQTWKEIWLSHGGEITIL